MRSCKCGTFFFYRFKTVVVGFPQSTCAHRYQKQSSAQLHLVLECLFKNVASYGVENDGKKKDLPLKMLLLTCGYCKWNYGDVEHFERCRNVNI